jgi:two-component system sensor histidine kinase QseC
LDWRRLWQPSLMRRSLAALLAAFVFVLLALLVHDYLEVKNDFDQNLAIKVRAEALAPIIARLTDPHEAGLVVVSVAEMFNTRRRAAGQQPGLVVHQLRLASGEVVVAVPASSDQAFHAETGRVTTADINGQSNWVVQVPAGKWLLVLADPATGEWPLLASLASDIVDKLLLAFPLVLLPVWLALRSGIRPLRQLAKAVSARNPNDLSPLGVQPPQKELKPLATAFEQLLAQLRQQVLLERSFVQDAAHEMRTPMAAIAAQAHVLARTSDPSARLLAAAALEQVLQRAAHLNQQLLELAVLDDGSLPPRHRQDVVTLVQQCLATAIPHALKLGLDLSLDAPEQLEQSLDLSAFQSVLNNLLDNAMRYVPRGGRINVILATAPFGWALTVADDGFGMTSEQRARAFDRFWRGDGVDKPGSGLGLSIVHRAAQRMGAEVRIDDGLDGRGVAFVLTVHSRP